MIKIGDRFEITKDKYQWLLTEFKDGISKKTKAPIRTPHTTYHGNTVQLGKALLERSAGDPSSIQQLIDTYERCTEEIGVWIQSAELLKC